MKCAATPGAGNRRTRTATSRNRGLEIGVRARFSPGTEADGSPVLLHGAHQLSYRVEDPLELRVVLFLQRRQLARQLCVRGKQPPQAHESTHDLDVDVHRLVAS